MVNTFSPRRTLAFIGAEPGKKHGAERITTDDTSDGDYGKLLETAMTKGVARSGARYKGCTLKFSGIAA